VHTKVTTTAKEKTDARAYGSYAGHTVRKSRCACAEMGEGGRVAVWRCGGVAVWRCGGVAVWRCGGVAVGRCGGGAVWRCGVVVWWSGGVCDVAVCAVWRCGAHACHARSNHAHPTRKPKIFLRSSSTRTRSRMSSMCRRFDGWSNRRSSAADADFCAFSSESCSSRARLFEREGRTRCVRVISCAVLVRGLI
jgi:hypothetical protein